ncbi:MAG: hypothetical protein WAW23_10625 [Candidatus Methanoperedens sp.]
MAHPQKKKPQINADERRFNESAPSSLSCGAGDEAAPVEARAGRGLGFQERC